MLMPLRWVFHRNGTTYTSLGLRVYSYQSIFQGVLASPPCNPIFLHLIRKFVLARKPIHSQRYVYTVQHYVLAVSIRPSPHKYLSYPPPPFTLPYKVRYVSGAALHVGRGDGRDHGPQGAVLSEQIQH